MTCCLTKHRDKTIYNLCHEDGGSAYHNASTCTGETTQENKNICVHKTAFETVITIFKGSKFALPLIRKRGLIYVIPKSLHLLLIALYLMVVY
jgi:hypothetical protein